MDKSPFNNLPGELRNRIWRFAVVSHEPINVTNRSTARNPAVLATCRQIRHESGSTYWAENRFEVFYSPYLNHIDINARWVRTIGKESAQQIQHLQLRRPHSVFLVYRESDEEEDYDAAVRTLLTYNNRQWPKYFQVRTTEARRFLRRHGIKPGAIEVMPSPEPFSVNDAKWMLMKKIFDQELEKAKRSRRLGGGLDQSVGEAGKANGTNKRKRVS